MSEEETLVLTSQLAEHIGQELRRFRDQADTRYDAMIERLIAAEYGVKSAIAASAELSAALRLHMEREEAESRRTNARREAFERQMSETMYSMNQRMAKLEQRQDQSEASAREAKKDSRWLTDKVLHPIWVLVLTGIGWLIVKYFT